MVIGCTLFAGAAQIMMKFGAGHPMPAVNTSQASSMFTFALALLANLPLMAGYALSACNAFLLIMALRDGELSVLYPVYSLSYVWVIALSMYFFHDQLNLWKTVGVVLIMTGVGLLGKVGAVNR